MKYFKSELMWTDIACAIALASIILFMTGCGATLPDRNASLATGAGIAATEIGTSAGPIAATFFLINSILSNTQ